MYFIFSIYIQFGLKQISPGCTEYMKSQGMSENQIHVFFIYKAGMESTTPLF